jgi:hypothetical protein
VASVTASPSANAVGGGFATVWSNVTNGYATDNSYVTCALGAGGISERVDYKGFDYSSIPAGSAITGVKMSVERSETGAGDGHIRDRYVGSGTAANGWKLLKAGTPVGTNKAATSTNWTTTDTYTDYGADGDLWGTTLTTPEVKNSGFGLSITVLRDSGTSGTLTAQIDHVQGTVYYTAPNVTASSPTYANGDPFDPFSWTTDAYFEMSSSDRQGWIRFASLSAVTSLTAANILAASIVVSSIGSPASAESIRIYGAESTDPALPTNDTEAASHTLTSVYGDSGSVEGLDTVEIDVTAVVKEMVDSIGGAVMMFRATDPTYAGTGIISATAILYITTSGGGASGAKTLTLLGVG